MVSLNDRQALAAISGADQHLRKLQLLLNGEQLPDAGAIGDGLHERLLAAIAGDEPKRFREVAGELALRKIKPESDWCHDDYLLFLLLLGKEKFGCSLPFLSQVMEARRKNPNPVPQKINEVFAALDREEFGFDGEFGFLKIPFLHLVGKLRVGPAEAKKVLQAMSAPALLDSMSPFLKLLTQKAYDLVLVERQPIPTETTTQLIEAIETHAKDLSLRNWSQVLTALPGRLIWTVVLAVIALGLIPVLFGVGKELVDVYFRAENRVRPAAITAAEIRMPGTEMPTEALAIAKNLSQPVHEGKRSLLMSVRAVPFATATPAFVVEVSHPYKPIRNAFAFVQGSTEKARIFTVVPVQRDGGRFRALLPPQSAGQTVNFVLEMEIDSTEDVNSVGNAIVLRSLE